MENDESQEVTQEEVSEETPTPDPLADIRQELKNTKAESARKTENIQQTLAQITAQLQAMSKPAPSQQEIPKDLMYDNPKEYARLIKEQAKSEAKAEILPVIEQQRQRDYAAANMQAQFPELKDAGSELYREASREFDNLPSHLKGTAEGMELAISKAAAMTGTLPVSKRKQVKNNDDFIPATTNTGRRPLPDKSKEASPDAIEFARILAYHTEGRDPNDPKLLEGIKKSSQRKDWKRYK